MKTLFKSTFVLGFICLLLMISGCSQQQESKLMKEVIKEDNFVELVSKIREDKSFTKDDIEYFVAALDRVRFVKDSVLGKTVGQIVETQKNIMREASLKNLNIYATREEMYFKMQMRFTQKLKLEKDTLNLNGIEFFVKNTSNKDITGIAGKIKVVNSYNQIVRILEVKYPNIMLKAGQEAQQREFWKHDTKNIYDSTFRSNPNLIAYWIPEEITFADGKKMSVNNSQQ
jgi:hypothetical protein